MDCNETRRLLDADSDGELDLVRHLELEAHLKSCPACAALAANARARRTALRENLPRFTASTPLAEKIRRSSPPTRAEIVPMPQSLPPPAARGVSSWWQLGGIAASLAVALFAGFQWGQGRARANALFDEAIADHVRSLQVAHLTDVTSTDQHTVKPWFAGKLDFSPPVVDLVAAGFPLTGGRLEHIDGRPAASLVFHRRQHAINLFIWPARESSMPNRALEREGYHVVAWTRAGMNFVAVSEIPENELAQFAEAFRQATP